jgi:abortive infection bacteriophage resistance protein
LRRNLNYEVASTLYKSMVRASHRTSKCWKSSEGVGEGWGSTLVGISNSCAHVKRILLNRQSTIGPKNAFNVANFAVTYFKTNNAQKCLTLIN